MREEMKTHVMRRIDPQTFTTTAEDSEDELIINRRVRVRPRATMFGSDSDGSDNIDGSDSIVGIGLLNRSQVAHEYGL